MVFHLTHDVTSYLHQTIHGCFVCCVGCIFPNDGYSIFESSACGKRDFKAGAGALSKNDGSWDQKVEKGSEND